MSQRNFNNVTTIGSLTGPVAASATVLTVQNFSQNPTPPFTATVDRNTATEEICLVTAVNGTQLTVVRGFDGTAAQAHSAGATVEHTAGAIEYIEANAHVNATTGVHGTSGDLVGDEGAQTIFDKTLVSPVLQADQAVGDALVAYIPPGAEARNLYTGMDPNGDTVASIDSSGNLNAQSLASTADTNVHGNLAVTGTSAHTGAATFASTVAVTGATTLSGTATVGGALAANGGVTVPTGKRATLTDAPTANTDGANKAYVDGKTWPSSKISDAASAATPSVVVARDAAGRAQFVDPAAAQDAATKNYVDNAVAAPAQGVIGYAFTTNTYTDGGLGTETRVTTFSVTLNLSAGRVYKVRTHGRGNSAAGATLFTLIVRAVAGAAQPTTGNTLVATDQTVIPGAGGPSQEDLAAIGLFAVSASGQFTLAPFIHSSTTAAISCLPPTGGRADMWVEDCGPLGSLSLVTV